VARVRPEAPGRRRGHGGCGADGGDRLGAQGRGSSCPGGGRCRRCAGSRGRAGAHPQAQGWRRGRRTGELIRSLLAALFARRRRDDGPMKVIVGMGNPGPEYERTRHNVGWWVLDHLADVWRFEGWKKDSESRVATGSVGGQRIRLVKPQTYMNLSGAALRPYLRREGWKPASDLLIIIDEVALPVGSFRIRRRTQWPQEHRGRGRLAGVCATPHRRRSRKPRATRRPGGLRAQRLWQT